MYDFHNIDVYPTAQEITKQISPNLPQNIVRGPYQNVRHYLDVHYHLLREDFVAPLRKVLCEYLEATRERREPKHSDITVYKSVRCLGAIPNTKRDGLLVQAFKPNTIDDPDRFMFGSLVCLTLDITFTNIIFGRIIEGGKEYIKKGQLGLAFENGKPRTNQLYIMVECNTYFEPYYHVLSALKKIEEHCFPFKEYLMDMRTETKLPDYLPWGMHLEANSAEKTLNPSQLAAYRAALSSKFCLVQGPPGTGKTFLALQITRRLLQRKSLWKGGPLLVICYKNHALDQFLEGLLDSTQHLVRVGGQCQSEKLKQYTIDNWRERYKLANRYPRINGDLSILKRMDVVGMTTTCAARMFDTLQDLACPIVIVEEAAECLESHIITALNPKCKHLILIGDHKQLQPSTADHDIGKKYKLGVSLFERMVMNGVQCHTLNVQHRMHPQIANLVSPAIYPSLENHESVYKYESIRGIDAPLFFITHDHRESQPDGKNSSSKKNHFEAEYLIRLARYLVLNRYDVSRITIIAAYAAQKSLLMDLKKKHSSLENIRICTLDGFQGDESDIILLSLVRNNGQGDIGFLNLENRVCVALSRAKHGMYIMGNMSQLRKASSIWRDVRKILQKYNALGSHLTARCVNHPESVTHLRDTTDFDKVSNGGCLKVCGKQLTCGHQCTKLCHRSSHRKENCNLPCMRVLCEFGHVCPDKCFMVCDKCTVSMVRTLSCGHKQTVPCHLSTQKVLCNSTISTTLPCGHKTSIRCYQSPRDVLCYSTIFITLPCGHETSIPCHQSTQKVPCLSTISTTLPCGHETSIRCYQSPREVLCNTPISITLPCGHVNEIPCFESSQTVLCNFVKSITLSCGHGRPITCHRSSQVVRCYVQFPRRCRGSNQSFARRLLEECSIM